MSLEITRTIPAPAEALFDAWLDPQALAAFMCPGPGVVAVDVEVDARVGGAFSLTMLAGEVRIPVEGVYRILERPRRLSFSWRTVRTTEDSLVTLTFEAAGAGTRLTLTHTGFVDEASREDHRGGWGHILTALEAALA